MRIALGHATTTIIVIILGIGSLRYAVDVWPLSFFYSLQTHIGLALVAASLMALAFRPGVAGLALLGLCLAFTGHSVVMLREFRPVVAPAERDASPVLRLLSFNVLGDNHENASQIVNTIVASQADVAIVLEAAPMRAWLNTLSATYPYRVGCGQETATCDLMLLSKRPFLKTRVASLSDIRRDRAIFVDIAAGGTTVRVAAVHLTKPYYDDYHQEELESLTVKLKAVTGPMILAGDFNSSVLAPDMQRLLRGLQLRSAPQEPATWPVLAGRFGIAIDHIFARSPLVARATTRLADNFGSNHYGLVTDFILR